PGHRATRLSETPPPGQSHPRPGDRSPSIRLQENDPLSLHLLGEGGPGEAEGEGFVLLGLDGPRRALVLVDHLLEVLLRLARQFLDVLLALHLLRWDQLVA